MTERCDQETLLSRAGDEDVWHVWSTDRRMMGRIRRLADSLGVEVKSGVKGGPWLAVRLPADRVNILKLRKAKSKPTGQNREDLVRRLRSGREAARIAASNEQPIESTGGIHRG